MSEGQAERFNTKLLVLCLVITVAGTVCSAQKLPNEIRGYKVYDAYVKITTSESCDAPDADFDAALSIGDPQPGGVSFSGLSFEIPARICSREQTGKIEFVSFSDFRVNGLPVEVEEFKYPFQLVKKTPTKLPRPAVVTVSAANLLKAAYREVFHSRKEWNITGTILVFGRFKKAIFGFKRVVPVRIDIKIPNPI